MNEQEYLELYDKIITNLKSSIIKVVFVKANGRERVMYATRNTNRIKGMDGFDSRIRSPQELAESRQNDINNGVVTVFDLQRRDWRRFSFLRLKSLEIYSEDLYAELPYNPSLT